MKKRVFLYVRVSTQEQARDGYSIDEQIERLKDYAKAMGWIVVKIYTDGGYSGSNIDRPALQSMIKDVLAGKGDSVVVYKLDRLSRSQKDTLELIEDYFLANKVDFVSMTENFDTATPFGRAIIGILSVFAQLEREQIKERMSMGREGRAKEGKFHGSHRALPHQGRLRRSAEMGRRRSSRQNGLLRFQGHRARGIRKAYRRRALSAYQGRTLRK